jgi:hypothetical protein
METHCGNTVGFFLPILFDQRCSLLIELDLSLIEFGTFLCHLGLVKLLFELSDTLLLWGDGFDDLSDGHDSNLVGVDVTAVAPY